MDSKSNIFLISPGGSGTLWMYHLFTTEYLCGGRKWFNPHQRFTKLPPKSKILYIMAHPLNILLSFHGRGFFDAVNHVINLQGDRNAYREVMQGDPSFEKYLRGGKNCLYFADHAIKWHAYAKENNLPHLFLKYEDLPKRWHEVTRFVGKDVDLAWVERSSKWQESKYSAKLAKIHKDDINFYENFYNILK